MGDARVMGVASHQIMPTLPTLLCLPKPCIERGASASSRTPHTPYIKL